MSDRRKHIEKTAQGHVFDTGHYAWHEPHAENQYEAFIAGAEWADANPSTEEWKPITETPFYDPKASEKDADVTIKASELRKLREANAEISLLKLRLSQVVPIIENMVENSGEYGGPWSRKWAAWLDRVHESLAETPPPTEGSEDRGTT